MAKDVCDILGLTNPTVALSYLNDTEKMILSLTYFQSPGRGGDNGKRVIVRESGVYKLIIRSRKPEAVAFQEWITSETCKCIYGSEGGYLGLRFLGVLF